MTSLIDDVTAKSSPLLETEGENLVFILGAPRSGTTWLAKIFDSHPDVLYRHEPSTVLRDQSFPDICPAEQFDAFADQARRYVLALLDLRVLKVVGSYPQFRKSYRSWPQSAAHSSLIYAMKLAEHITNISALDHFNIPDMATWHKKPTLVFKSVSSSGRAGLFLRSFPRAKMIFILRHPCAQVASMVKGVTTGKFDLGVDPRDLAATFEARSAGYTSDDFNSDRLVSAAAWSWALLNQKMMNDLRGEKRAMVVRYEDLCRAPEITVRALFDFTGISWSRQAADFVRRSTTAPDTDEYYYVLRDSMKSMDKWKDHLSEKDRRLIECIAARVPVGTSYEFLEA